MKVNLKHQVACFLLPCLHYQNMFNYQHKIHVNQKYQLLNFKLELRMWTRCHKELDINDLVYFELLQDFLVLRCLLSPVSFSKESAVAKSLGTFNTLFVPASPMGSSLESGLNKIGIDDGNDEDGPQCRSPRSVSPCFIILTRSKKK